MTLDRLGPEAWEAGIRDARLVVLGAGAYAGACRAGSSAAPIDRSSSPVTQRRLPHEGGRRNPAGAAALMRGIDLLRH
jgi:hypothetical protein